MESRHPITTQQGIPPLESHQTHHSTGSLPFREGQGDRSFEETTDLLQA